MQAKNVEPVKNHGRTDLSRENARLRGDLLSIARRISHDLRTPLGAIICSGEALREVLVEQDPASLSLVASSLNSAEELSQLIKRTSFVLKATAQPIAPEPTPMGGPVDMALQRLQRRTLQREAVIAQPESWPEINGVSSWLETIWWNLLANALQHADASPLRIELGWIQEAKNFRFWISDNGSGVPANRRKKLFQPFESLHELDAAPGLGLSMVHRLVELHGGSCGYEANPRGGACFFFLLP